MAILAIGKLRARKPLNPAERAAMQDIEPQLARLTDDFGSFRGADASVALQGAPRPTLLDSPSPSRLAASIETAHAALVCVVDDLSRFESPIEAPTGQLDTIQAGLLDLLDQINDFS